MVDMNDPVPFVERRKPERRCGAVFSGLLTLCLVWTGAVASQEEPALLQPPPQLLEARPFLRYQRPIYRNYAFQFYTNPSAHSFNILRRSGDDARDEPYSAIPKTYYGHLGNFLSIGFDLYHWTETRAPGLRYGSSIGKDLNQFQNVMNHLVVARDGYRNWGYSAIVGDGLIARLSPLTLSMVDFNGTRFDLFTRWLKFSFMGSRIAKPTDGAVRLDDTVIVEGALRNFRAVASVLLLGGRVQADVGRLSLGLNGANIHLFHSTRQGGGSLKGSVHPQQPFLDWVVVRFSDDSPRDGIGGALVQEIRLILNGSDRPDLRPLVIRHRSGAPTQVGTKSVRTGQFRSILYTEYGGRSSTVAHYGDRDPIPPYADYLYRYDYEAGVDVSEISNVEGLLSTYHPVSADEVQEVGGVEQVVYLFDLSGEPLVRRVEVEALVGNDYRVDVATLIDIDDGRASNRTRQFRSTFYRTVERARGNVRDLSNLRRLRFEVGTQTGLFTYSADARLRLAGLEVEGEYARSALYSRYPGRQEEEPLYGSAPSYSESGSAYFLNGVRWFGRARLGGEYFSINPDYRTTLRTFEPETFLCCYGGRMGGLVNDTMYWDLVEDNEDGDRYPDRASGVILGAPTGRFLGAPIGSGGLISAVGPGRDGDGVDVGLDADRDGVSDVNRNFNGVPDYHEPFLMYWVEPNDYTYGLDRNHNDELDAREDDEDWDYPYDHDQRGFHLFGQVDLSRHWSLGVGRYRVGEVAGPGRNHSTYALLSYRRQGVERLRNLFFENHLHRVRDDIGDEYNTLIERAIQFIRQRRADQLLYQDSYVNESFLEGQFNPWSTLWVVQQVRLRLNWQQGGQVRRGVFQRQRRLDYWTWVGRAEYTWRRGKLSLTPHFKLMVLRLEDRGTQRILRSERHVIPIVRAIYPLLARTLVQAGVQGWGPWPYRFRDGARQGDSFERRTAFVNLINRSRYFGYDLNTIVGTKWDARTFDVKFQRFRDFDSWSFFVRTLIGFTEYGSLL